MQSRQPIWTYRTVLDDSEPNFLATDRDGVCGWSYGKPGSFFGMLAKRLIGMSKKFLALLAKARQASASSSSGVLNWRRSAFPFSSTNFPKFIDVRVLILGFKMFELCSEYAYFHLNMLSESEYIFIRWPPLTWPWAWHALSISLLHGIFVLPSVSFWQSFGLQLSLVWSRRPIRRKESEHLTWRWPDIWPCLGKKLGLH